MQAAILHAPLDLRFEKIPIPRISHDEILVRVRATLTCGTDYKAYLRGHPKIRIPGPLGHEFSGEIAAVGPSVRNFQVGDSVACVHTAPCGACFFCQKHQENLCVSLTDQMAYGSYAEYIRIPSHVVMRNCMHLPQGISYAAAALMEPLACCIHGMKTLNLREGETVIIIGDGPIALMMLALARKRGAGRILLVGQNLVRMKVAEELGADVTCHMGSSDEKIYREFPPRGADAVLECVGLTDTWKRSLLLARLGGRILFFGGCPSGHTVEIDAEKIHYGNISMYGSFHYTPADVREALEFISVNKKIPDFFITQTVPLSEIVRVFSDKKQADYVKVAFIP